MAVKRKKTLAPPVYRTGGKDEHYAIELLLSERQLILSRIRYASAEIPFNIQERKKEIARWSALAAQLYQAALFLKENKDKMIKAGGVPVPAGNRAAIASCKHFAKCGNHSYFYCFSKCEKRKLKTCELVRKYTRRKKAA